MISLIMIYYFRKIKTLKPLTKYQNIQSVMLGLAGPEDPVSGCCFFPRLFLDRNSFHQHPRIVLTDRGCRRS